MSYQRAFIFANGELPDSTWLKSILTSSDLLVAADGGLKHLQSLNIPPQLLIGDFDSVSADQMEWAKEHGSQIERYPIAKNETDLELALFAAVKLGCHEIIIVAGLGGRLDQTLGNLSLLRLPELQDCSVRFEDGREEVFLVRSKIQISGQPGDIVSLLPLWGAVTGVVTENLAYPLHDETLYPDNTRGISNAMNAPLAQVSVTSGDLLCIHTHNPLSVQEK
ncbi:MAG: thiamine diphosphokinase [Anaerolineaceae bacterium]